MSKEQLISFMNFVKRDDALRERLMRTSRPQEVVEIAAEYGYDFTEQEFLSNPDMLDDEEDKMWSKVVKYEDNSRKI